jgi:hypothetical protein
MTTQYFNPFQAGGGDVISNGAHNPTCLTLIAEKSQQVVIASLFAPYAGSARSFDRRHCRPGHPGSVLVSLYLLWYTQRNSFKEAYSRKIKKKLLI